MSDYAMPELPKSYFWRVKPAGGYVFRNMIAVELREKLGPFSLCSRKHYFTATDNPEANAASCVLIAERLYTEEWPLERTGHRLNVNGLKGAVIAKGIDHAGN